MAKIKIEGSVKEQAKAFLELSPAKKAEAITSLLYAVQMEVREIVEKARGVRHVNGKLEFSIEELKAQIKRLEEKKESFAEREVVLTARINELNEELSTR